MLDLAQFRSPAAEFRPVAMWFLNGRLDRDEILRQIGEMARGGIGAIQVAARTGLEVPYFSEEWFELIRLIMTEARRHGMGVWLADEYPYPSGASGGEIVLRHPELRAWQMRARRERVPGGEVLRAEAPGSVALRSVAVPLDEASGEACWREAVSLDQHVGLWQREQVLFQPSSVYLTTRRYMSNRPVPTLTWRAPETARNWHVWLIAAAEITDYKFFGSYVDLCNPDACRLFIETTYERYVQRLGPDKFGELAGFFLDESHPQNWSWRLPDAFRRRNGYDLLEVLPSLWTETGSDTARVRYDYWQTITELFVEHFHRPLAAWCTAHRVQLSLEVPSTRNVVQRFAHVPGIDPGHDKVGTSLDAILARELVNYRGNLTFPASLAAQTGRQRVLDELFHSVGWSLTLQDMKAMLDRAAACGANLFAFHAFCYTIGGLRKWDAPPSEFDQNPYWAYFSQLSIYAGRLAYAMSRGARASDVAVLDPVSTLWSHQDAAGTRDEVALHTAEQWALLLRELMGAQRPHDTLDPLLLADAEIAGGRLRIGDAAYRVLVLPPTRSLERAAWEKLEQFVTGGGHVIACDELPSEEIEVDGDVVGRCAKSVDGLIRVDSIDALLARLEQLSPAALRVRPDDGDRARREFLVARRRDGDEDLWLVANSGADAHACEVRLRYADRQPHEVVRYDLETGACEVLSSVREAAEIVMRLEFAAYGAELLSVRQARHASGEDSATSGVHVTTVDVDLDGDWACTPAEDNILRLDRFWLSIGDRDGAVLVEPKPLIAMFQDVVGSGGRWPGPLSVPPIFGALPRIQLELPSTLRLRARFDVDALPRRAWLCIEDAALSGAWAMWLNGAPVAEFVRRRRWDVGNREAEVRRLLRLGENELAIEVHASESWDGLLDAVHLIGDFGVFFRDASAPVLRTFPTSLRWAERHTSGVPYYAGTLHLTRRVEIPLGRGATRLRLPDAELMFAGVAELSVDGRSLGARTWAPYAWTLPADATGSTVELTLSITNTLIEQLEGRRYDPASRGAVPIVNR